MATKRDRVIRRKEQLDRQLGPAPVGSQGWARWARANFEVEAQDRGAATEREFEDEPATCPYCGGPGVALGSLGHIHHFRCRDCGINFTA